SLFSSSASLPRPSSPGSAARWNHVTARPRGCCSSTLTPPSLMKSASGLTQSPQAGISNTKSENDFSDITPTPRIHDPPMHDARGVHVLSGNAEGGLAVCRSGRDAAALVCDRDARRWVHARGL